MYGHKEVIAVLLEKQLRDSGQAAKDLDHLLDMSCTRQMLPWLPTKLQKSFQIKNHNGALRETFASASIIIN